MPRPRRTTRRAKVEAAEKDKQGTSTGGSSAGSANNSDDELDPSQQQQQQEEEEVEEDQQQQEEEKEALKPTRRSRRARKPTNKVLDSSALSTTKRAAKKKGEEEDNEAADRDEDKEDGKSENDDDDDDDKNSSKKAEESESDDGGKDGKGEKEDAGSKENNDDEEDEGEQQSEESGNEKTSRRNQKEVEGDDEKGESDSSDDDDDDEQPIMKLASEAAKRKLEDKAKAAKQQPGRRMTRRRSRIQSGQEDDSDTKTKTTAKKKPPTTRSRKRGARSSGNESQPPPKRRKTRQTRFVRQQKNSDDEEKGESSDEGNPQENEKQSVDDTKESNEDRDTGKTKDSSSDSEEGASDKEQETLASTTRGKKTHDRRKRTKSSAKQAGKGKRGDQSSDEEDNEKSNAKPKTRKRSRGVKKSENDTGDSSGEYDDDKITGEEKIKASDNKTKKEATDEGDDKSKDNIESDSDQSSATAAKRRTRGNKSGENDASDKDEMCVIDEADEDEGSGEEHNYKAANESGTNEESGEAPLKGGAAAGKEIEAKDKAEAMLKSEPGAGDESEKQKEVKVDSGTGKDEDGKTSGGYIEARDKDDNKGSEGADLDETPQKVHDVIEIDLSEDEDEKPKKDETAIDSKPEDESSTVPDGKDEIESKKTQAKEESSDDSETIMDSHKSKNAEAQMDEAKDADAEIELPSSQEKQAKAVAQDANIEIASDQGSDAEGEKDGGKDTEAGSKNPETESDILDSHDAKAEINVNVTQDANAEVKIIEARDTEVNEGLLSTQADTNRDLNNEKRGECGMEVEGEMGQRLAFAEDERKPDPAIEEEPQLRQKRDPEGDKLVEVVSITIKKATEGGDICTGEDAGEQKLDDQIRQINEKTIHENEAAREVTTERDVIIENREKKASEENENEAGDKMPIGAGDKIELEVIIGENAGDNKKEVGVEGTDKSKVALENEVESMADQQKATAATQSSNGDTVVSAQPTGEKTAPKAPSNHLHEEKSLHETQTEIQSGSLVDTQKESLSKISDEGPVEGSSLELGNGKNADEKRDISNKLVTTGAETILPEVNEGTTTQKEQEIGSNSGDTLQKEGYIHDGDSFHTPPEHPEEQTEDGLSHDDEAPSPEKKLENEETSHVPEKGTPEVSKPEAHQNAAISNEAAVPLWSKPNMLGKREHSMDKGLAVESFQSNDGGTVSADDKKPDVIIVPGSIKLSPQKSQENFAPEHVKSKEVEPEVESVDNQEKKTHSSSLNSHHVTTMSQSEQKDAVLVVTDKTVMKPVPPANFRVGPVSNNHEKVGIEAVSPTYESSSLESPKPWGSITNSFTQQPTVASEKSTTEHITPRHVDTTGVALMDAQSTNPTLAKKRSRESGDENIVQIEELPPKQKKARMIAADSEYQSTPADFFPRKKTSEAAVQQPVIQTIRRCDLDKVKMLLFSAGNMVHRGRGFERIFAQYWSALSLIVAGSRSGENLVKLRGVVKSFLRTKRLKKLHNKLIMALIGRSLQDTIPISEISGVVPPSCQGRVKIVSAKDMAPAATKQLVPLPASPPLVEANELDTFLQENALPYAPLFAELSKKQQNASDCDEDELASSLPGALVVDPFVREMVQSEGLRVSENAVWLFVIAVREYIKAMLGKAIQSKEARHNHRTPPSSKAPVVLCKPGGSTKAPSQKKEKVNANETSKKTSLGLWQDNVISPSDLSLLAANMHMSPVDSLGGTISRLACERCIFAPADISRAIRGSAFEDIHSFLTSEITAAATERQKLLKTQRSTSRTTTSPTARPASRDGQPDAAKAKKEDFSVPKTKPAPTPAPAPIPAPAPAPVERRTVRSPVPGLGRGGKNLGLGRGAKNLAALMARTAVVATKVSSPAKPAVSTSAAAPLAPSNAASSGPTPAGQSVSAEGEASKNSEPTTNQVKGLANSPSAGPAPAQAPQNQPGSTPEKKNNPNQVVIRGRGLGKKNLAAMRARIVKPPEPSDSGASHHSDDKASDTPSPSPAGAPTPASQGVVSGGGQSNSAASGAPQLASTDKTSGVTGPTPQPTASASSLLVVQASTATAPATVSHSSQASPGAGNTVQGSKSPDKMEGVATSPSASQSNSAVTASPNQEKIADASNSVPPKEDTSSAPANTLVPDAQETKLDVQPQEKTESQNSAEKSTISLPGNKDSSSLTDVATNKEEVNGKDDQRNIPVDAKSGEAVDKEDKDAKPEGDASNQTASEAKSAEEFEAIGDKTSSSDNAGTSNKTAAEENKSSAGEVNELKSVEQNNKDPASAPGGTTTNETTSTAKDSVPTSDPATGDEPQNQEAGEGNAAEDTAGTKGNESAKATEHRDIFAPAPSSTTTS